MLASLLPLVLAAGWARGDAERLARGRATYEAACALCHGADGRGNPEWESRIRPLDLSDCETTAEPTDLWEAIVREGGADRGLDPVMPAFGEAFSVSEISDVVAYLRTFCSDAERHPPGDLNFRRLLHTGKAFPEREVVLRPSFATKEGSREAELDLVYENRLGPRFQYELELPLRLSAEGDEPTGAGDLAVGAKQVLYFDPRHLQILSGGLEVTLPTGSEKGGLGTGTVAVSPFLAYGKAWGRTLLQAKASVAVPFDRGRAPLEASFALGGSRLLGPSREAFAPAVELEGAYDFEEGRSRWAVWLECSKPLNRLGHVMGAIGVRVPLRPRDESTKVVAYLLWDFGDGPFWIGW